MTRGRGEEAPGPSGELSVCVKICGIVRPEDAFLSARLGAAYLGFVLAPSPRRADPAEIGAWLPDLRAAHPGVATVGVFVDPGLGEAEALAARLQLDLVQVHRASQVPPVAGVPWIRACGPDELPRVPRGEPGGPFAWLVDTPSGERAGGTGRTFDWSRVPSARGYRLFLAGGLDPANVGQAIRSVRPYAVDASSRLESRPGAKDPERLRSFFEGVRQAAELVSASSPLRERESPRTAGDGSGTGPPRGGEPEERRSDDD